MSDTTVSLFVGAFVRRLDAKKRIVLPAEWRSVVGEPTAVFVLMSPDEPCLRVYPARTIRERIGRSLSLTDVAARKAMQVLGARSALLSWDAAGRIRLPDALLVHARITGAVRLAGALSHFEIWNDEADAADPAGDTHIDVMRGALRNLGL